MDVALSLGRFLELGGRQMWRTTVGGFLLGSRSKGGPYGGRLASGSDQTGPMGSCRARRGLGKAQGVVGWHGGDEVLECGSTMGKTGFEGAGVGYL
jgi:hypothetical protein